MGRKPKEPGSLVPILPSGVQMGPLRLAAAKQMVAAALLAPDNFPELPPEMRGRRKLYVRGVNGATQAGLESKGYVVVDLMTLPRTTVHDHVNYMLARAQGIEEGTLFATDAEQKALWLQMRAFGLLDQRSLVPGTLEEKDAPKEQGVEAVLAWGESKHSLRGNTTVQGITAHTPRGRVAVARDPAESAGAPSAPGAMVIDAEEKLQ